MEGRETLSILPRFAATRELQIKQQQHQASSTMDGGRHSRLLIVCFLVVVGSPLLFLLQQESSSDLLSGGQVPKNKNQNTSGNTSSNRGSKIVPLLAVVDHDRNHDDGINNKNTSSNPTDREVEGAVKALNFGL